MTYQTDSTHAVSFPPIAAENAEILILGSMPGIASLEQQQYYAHPRNAFWPIMAKVFNFDSVLNYQQRCSQLIKHQVALWDVLKMCRRPGSLDQHIERETIVINDLMHFLTQHTAIELIIFNGTTAANLFKRHILPELNSEQRLITLERLPSTSPAHASLSFEEKLSLWKQVIEKKRQ